MKRFFQTLKNIWKIEELRKRILYTLALLAVYRLGCFVVIPGIDASQIDGTFDLVLRATELTEISKEDIEGLPIAAFVIGSKSGITYIPQDLFAVCDKQGSKTTVVWNFGDLKQNAEINEANTATAQADKLQKIAAKRKELMGVKKSKLEDWQPQDGWTVDKDEEAAFADENFTENSLWGKYKKAVEEKEAADEAVSKAQRDLDVAKAYQTLGTNANITDAMKAKAKAAEALEAAIAAFETKDPAKFATLQNKIKAEISNVNEVTPWYAAFATATGLVEVGPWWNTLITNVQKAYEDFYGSKMVVIGDKVQGMTANLYKATGDVSTDHEYSGDAVLETNKLYTGFVLQDVSAENTNVVTGYKKVKCLEGPSSLVNKIYYLVDGYTADESKFYVLSKYDARSTSKVSPVVTNNQAILVNITRIDEYELTRENVAAMDAADPERDINLAKAAANPTEQSLKDAVDAAQEALDNANDAASQAETDLADAKNAVKTAQEELAKIKGTALYTSTTKTWTEYNPEKQNTTLLLGAFNNGKITGIGEHAFANCVNAKFNHTFPATIEEIKKEAFLNTQIEEADFSKATSEDLEIANDAFKGTPLKKLMLNGTTSEQITPELVRTIVASIAKADEDLEIVFCNDTKTLAAGEYNTTLTTVTLPEGEYYTDILKATFDKCWGLTSVMIPATITDIQVQAFRFTNVDKFDLTANTGLSNVGKAAFAWNPSLTSVKFAPEAEMTSLEKTTFWGACALNEVVFNDAMTLLPEGLFSTNALAELNLCNTNVQVLYNLFLAGPGPDAIYPEAAMPNTTLESVCLPEGLVVIKRGALAYMHNANFTDVEIPGNVIYMEDDVLRWCANLKTVTIMDSRMIGLPPHTFAQDANLEKLTFITLNTINPNPLGTQLVDGLPVTPEPVPYPGGNDKPIAYTINADGTVTVISEAVARWGQCFGDNIFFACTKRPLVEVGLDSYNKLIAVSEFIRRS